MYILIPGVKASKSGDYSKRIKFQNENESTCDDEVIENVEILEDTESQDGVWNDQCVPAGPSRYSTYSNQRNKKGEAINFLKK